MTIDLLENSIIDSQTIEKLVGLSLILDAIDLGNGKSILTIPKTRDDKSSMTNMTVSIGIAAAITAYARMHMMPLLQSKKYNVYYTDTDSIVTDTPISSEFIGKALGQLKLEYNIRKGIFLAPKVYSLITNEGKIVTKIKGFKESNIGFDVFDTLLYKGNTASLKHEKSFKDFSKGEIEIKKQAYLLKSTDNKREFIYNDKNKAFDTKPFVINNDREKV
jgi:hypothetical protein